MRITRQRRHPHVKEACLHSTSRERGSVLAEFVMVAPVMLLIAGSALRFYQELQAQEIGLTYAREVATLAYNKCVDMTRFSVSQVGATTADTVTVNKSATESAITACLDGVKANFEAGWSFTKPIAGSSSVTITLAVRRCNITEVVPTTCDSPSTITVGSGQLPETTLTLFRNRLVVARISFDSAPLATFIPSISSRSVTYDATV